MSDNPYEVLQTLKSQAKTLQLATLNNKGQPAISYAPFVLDADGDFYVYVSELASHTAELLTHGQAAVLLIADEQDTKQIFARTRANFDCLASVVDQGEAAYEEILDRFEFRFGNVMNVLRTLNDFRLIRLHPISGRFVMGFAQAFELAGPGMTELTHISRDT
ncbi:MAG: HugZ family protein [Oceanobacter sp.]